MNIWFLRVTTSRRNEACRSQKSRKLVLLWIQILPVRILQKYIFVLSQVRSICWRQAFEWLANGVTNRLFRWHARLFYCSVFLLNTWRSIVWVKSVVLFRLRDLHLDLISKTMDLASIVVKFSFLPLAKRGKKACNHNVKLSFVLIFVSASGRLKTSLWES